MTVVVQPVLPNVLPALPESPFALFLLIFGEAFIGLFLGSVARLLMAALSIGGMMIDTVTGLANLLTHDPTAAQQGSTTRAFPTILALPLHLVPPPTPVRPPALPPRARPSLPGHPPSVRDIPRSINRVV